MKKFYSLILLISVFNNTFILGSQSRPFVSSLIANEKSIYDSKTKTNNELLQQLSRCSINDESIGIPENSNLVEELFAELPNLDLQKALIKTAKVLLENGMGNPLMKKYSLNYYALKAIFYELLGLDQTDKDLSENINALLQKKLKDIRQNDVRYSSSTLSTVSIDDFYQKILSDEQLAKKILKAQEEATETLKRFKSSSPDEQDSFFKNLNKESQTKLFNSLSLEDQKKLFKGLETKLQIKLLFTKGFREKFANYVLDRSGDNQRLKEQSELFMALGEDKRNVFYKDLNLSQKNSLLYLLASNNEEEEIDSLKAIDPANSPKLFGGAGVQIISSQDLFGESERNFIYQDPTPQEIESYNNSIYNQPEGDDV